MSINPLNVAKAVCGGRLEEVHTDGCRTIFACNLLASSLQSVHQAQPLGNHCHKKKQETLPVTGGAGKCVDLPLTADEEPDGAQVTMDGEKGSVIQVRPCTAQHMHFDSNLAARCSVAQLNLLTRKTLICSPLHPLDREAFFFLLQRHAIADEIPHSRSESG